MIDLNQDWALIRVVSLPDIDDRQCVLLEDLYQAFKERMMRELEMRTE